MKIVTSILLFGLMFFTSPASAMPNHPACPDESYFTVRGDNGIDYGWFEDKTCIVESASGNASGFPACPDASYDSDGDRYGWYNSATCWVLAEDLNPTVSKYPYCPDESFATVRGLDGILYGWYLDATCIVDESDADGGGTDGGSTDGGSTDGGSTDGGSTDGGSTDGGSTDGGSTDGGSTDGGSTDGGSTDGGSTDGGSKDGGSTDGGSTDGGSTDGGSTDGGSTDGGSTDGGSTDGGNTDGGSTDGGSTDGGSTDGGSTDGGSTDGGATDGGSTDGGSTDGGSTDGGSTDGGSTDGGSTDGGSTDGGSTDGGSTDGGSTDGGGTDGGTTGGGTTGGGTTGGGTTGGSTGERVSTYSPITQYPDDTCLTLQDTRDGNYHVPILLGDFILSTNPWNFGAAGDYPWEQCVFSGTNGEVAGWTYDWGPGGGSSDFQVRSYPELIYGVKSQGEISAPKSVTGLPARVGDLPVISIDYSYSGSENGPPRAVEIPVNDRYAVGDLITGERNLAVESFFHPADASGNCPESVVQRNSSGSNHTYELMVWLDSGAERLPSGPADEVTTATIDGVEYRVFTKAGDLKYVAFVAVNPQQTGTIVWTSFIDWAQIHAHRVVEDFGARTNSVKLQDDWCLGNILVGNEIFWGAGNLNLLEWTIRQNP